MLFLFVLVHGEMFASCCQYEEERKQRLTKISLDENDRRSNV